MAMKTVRQWLKELKPEKVRTQALVNCDTPVKLKKRSLYGALLGAFVWADSPEGSDYWINVSRKLKPKYDEI